MRICLFHHRHGARWAGRAVGRQNHARGATDLFPATPLKRRTHARHPAWPLRLAGLLAAAVTAGLVGVTVPSRAEGAPAMKESSIFYPRHLVEKAQANIARYPWAAEMQRQIVARAQWWTQRSDEELWDLMFGSTITRSWMVWSNGHCPACKEGVPMYTWQIDALQRPWKVVCPHCQEAFPKNDFARFYRSGLDEHGVFDPRRADRSLLFNEEHPAADDPLRQFGVDDGEGYVDGDKRWRFIGCYLIYGQWKQAIVAGITHLAAAYVVTGEPIYAHKAGVLLDRVADLYPTHDFKLQGKVYEQPGAAGYVSTWHDACQETRALAFAYDQVFEGLREDPELVAFLSRKARQYQLENPKDSFAQIQRNIEERILRDAVVNRHKIASNYPTTDVTVALCRTILDWPADRAAIEAMIDEIITRCTAVDGMTGEKGLAGYSTIGPNNLAEFLGYYARVDPEFLPAILKRHPRLHQTYRFHIDTWCLGAYYPQTGDSGTYVTPVRRYLGLNLGSVPRSAVANTAGSQERPVMPLPPSVGPAPHAFLWQLYQATGDVAFAQVLYQSNGGRAEGLPYDLFAADPAALQRDLKRVIDREGEELRLGSVNKEQWRLAILRSGSGAHARAAWLDYDAGGAHGHHDGLNLGLFARGLDLLPEFGYPPVHFGGWSGPKFSWYVRSAGHNTVVIDGKDQVAGNGETTLWADGKEFHAIRASAPALVAAPQYERTVALVDLSPEACYLLDLFRVVGGNDHAWFLHSHFGDLTTTGLNLAPAADYGHDTQMRHFRGDFEATPGWVADWKVNDRDGHGPSGQETHLRYTGLTRGAQVYTAEAWVCPGGFQTNEEAWIPRLLVRRQAAQAPLRSAFVGILEPYGTRPAVASARRLALHTPAGAAYPDNHAAVEVRLVDGRRDLLVAADVENPLGLRPALREAGLLVQREWGLRTDAELCLVRRNQAGAIERVVLCRGKELTCGGLALRLKEPADLVEVSVVRGEATLVTGSTAVVAELRAAPGERPASRE